MVAHYIPFTAALIYYQRKEKKNKTKKKKTINYWVDIYWHSFNNAEWYFNTVVQMFWRDSFGSLAATRNRNIQTDTTQPADWLSGAWTRSTHYKHRLHSILSWLQQRQVNQFWATIETFRTVQWTPALELLWQVILFHAYKLLMLFHTYKLLMNLGSCPSPSPAYYSYEDYIGYSSQYH